MKINDSFDESLNAALASLPQLRPSAAFSKGVLGALARRPAAAPAWPLAAALTLSSAAIAAAALNLTITIPQVASRAAHLLAAAQVAGRFVLQLMPAPRAGAEFSAAALVAVALFFTISLPRSPKTRLIGAKS